MNKKRGRIPDRGVLSGITPDQPWDEIRARVTYDSAEWAMVATRYWIGRGCDLHGNRVAPLWDRLCAEFERAVLNGDPDWFRRQWQSFGSLQSQNKIQFNAKVIELLEQAMWETLGRPENWRPLTDDERERFPNLRRVPQAVTLTRLGPAGMSTDETAKNIYDALEKHEKNGVLFVEGCQFDSKKLAIQAIRDLADRFRFELKKRRRPSATS